MPITIKRTGLVFMQRPYYKPAYKIDITRKDSTVDTVADSTSASASSLISLSCKLGMNGIAGSFMLMLSNKDGKWTNTWTGNERIDIWADFGNAGYKIFRGRCENIQYLLSITGGHQMLVSGSDGMGELQDKSVVGNFMNVEGSSIYSSIITQASSDVTYTVSPTGVTIQQITLRDLDSAQAISEVSSRIGHDAYVDSNYVLQHFLKNSVNNDIETAVHGSSLKFLQMGIDTRKVKNFVRVYGANVDNSTNVLLVKTAEDTDSQTSYGTKYMIVNDFSINTNDAAQEKADSLLAENKDNSQNGTVTAIGMPTLRPGQCFRISSPYDNVNGYYRAQEVTHQISVQAGFLTTVTVEKYPELMEQSVASISKGSSSIADFTVTVPLIDSFVIKFDETLDVVTHSNTTITNGKLKIASGSEGTATSNTFTARKNVSTFELRVSGTDTASCTFKVSNDEGQSYTSVTANSTTHISFPEIGKKIKIQITMVSDSNNVDPTIECIGVMLK